MLQTSLRAASGRAESLHGNWLPRALIWQMLLIGLLPHGGGAGSVGGVGGVAVVAIDEAINTNCAITSTLNKP